MEAAAERSTQFEGHIQPEDQHRGWEVGVLEDNQVAVELEPAEEVAEGGHW